MVPVLQEASDIGISYKMLIRNKAGEKLIYDGVLWRITEMVHENNFTLNQLDQLTGWLAPPGDIVDQLLETLRERIHDFPEGMSFYSFYTVNSTDWDDLGFRREGHANLRVSCKGVKNFSIYIGNRTEILQMIASDLYIGMELKKFLRYFDDVRIRIENINKKTSNELDGMLAPFLRFNRKHKQWVSVKESLQSLTQIYSLLGKGSLLVNSLSKAIDERLAFSYPGRTQRSCPGFFYAEFENSQLNNLSEQPEEPMYIYEYKKLETKVEKLRTETIFVLNTERDLLTAFQTEFSLYAVWFAVMALILSLITTIIQICQQAN